MLGNVVPAAAYKIWALVSEHAATELMFSFVALFARKSQVDWQSCVPPVIVNAVPLGSVLLHTLIALPASISSLTESPLQQSTHEASCWLKLPL